MKIKNNQLIRRLGYEFKDPSLLKRALSHRSVGKDNNERLEFLGDSLLNFIIADALCKKFPSSREGDLSRLRATLVQGKTLAELAREFLLGDNLILGEGEMKSGGFRRDSILADAVEAIIGAIYSDSDFIRCQQIVLSWFDSRLDNITLENTDKDPKTRLQEHLQENKKPLPIYTVIETRGEAHAKEFVIECRLESVAQVFVAVSSSKRAAEKLAAEKMLNHLKI
ncbi:ribonuclease III [Agarilytica rhodophyticola]|uniref:ribonuclease III n=1 Tax=Agarilytica rhodophyticola TaxID=1737490 RepID=UPI000B34655F|nr:ribonuclease III [Agarilytica rhodophyticola]